jgi:hypothetical protein
MLKVWVADAMDEPTELPSLPTLYTLSVIGSEKVAPGVVEQSPLYQCPLSQPQLLIRTATVGFVRAVPASWI